MIRGNHIAEVIIALPSHQHQQILRTVRHRRARGGELPARARPLRAEPLAHRCGCHRGHPADRPAADPDQHVAIRDQASHRYRRRPGRAADRRADLAADRARHQARLARPGLLSSRCDWAIAASRSSVQVPLDACGRRSPCRSACAIAAGDERGKFKLHNDPRRTRVGVFIRKTSLDEMPQILNVLRAT